MSGSRGFNSAWLSFARICLGAAFALGALQAMVLLAGGEAYGTLRSGARMAHISCTLVFWPLALMAGLWSRDFPSGARRLAGLALVLSAAGGALALLMSWGRGGVLGSALLVLKHPLYGAALALFLAGIGIALVLRIRSAIRRQVADPLLWYPVVPFVLLFAAIASTWLAAGDVSNDVRGSSVSWAAHTQLSFLQLALLLRGWFWLAERDRGNEPLRGGWRHLVMFLAVLPAVLAVLLPLAIDFGDDSYFPALDLLVSWGSWPAALLGGLILVVQRRRLGRPTADSASRAALLISMGLFWLGALSSVFNDQAGMLYRAQMHWMGGALVVAYLALLRPDGIEGQAWRRWEQLLPGLALAVLGAMWAVSAYQGGGSTALPFGQALALVMLGFAVSRPLASRLRSALGGGLVGRIGQRLAMLDMRWRALWATTFAIGIIGGIIASLSPWGRAPDRTIAPVSGPRHDHAVEQMRSEVQQRFAQGVAMLQAKRYDDAATAFHRVLALAPDMPEAYVNMGFAMLGKEDYRVALDFFEGATQLRVNQVNAYYGMALAHEQLGDLDAAIGAIRTYQHLSAPDDPFRDKAMAKLQDYERRRAAAPGAGGR